MNKTPKYNGTCHPLLEMFCRSVHRTWCVDGKLTIDPTAGDTQTTVSMALPFVEGNFSAIDDAVGTFTAFDDTADTFVPGTVWANIGAQTVVFNFRPTSTNDHSIYFHREYQWQN